MNSIQDLSKAILESHGVGSIHMSSIPVRQKYGQGQVWDGVVEVFMLTNHSKAKTAYAWTHAPGGNDGSIKHITILHLPPVDSPQTAVRAAYDSQVFSAAYHRQGPTARSSR
jgi:hypothetical protein